MSARDLIINSLMKPIETQVDYSQGYDVGLNAQANRVTPEQVRQRDLANAIQRNQQRIQTQITGQDNTLDSASKLLGYDLREQSSANLRGMTSEQRLQSYVTGSNHDPELAYDMQNMNDGYLLNVGLFINSVISFLIIAAAIFMVVKALNSMKRKAEEVPAAPAEPSEDILLLREIRDSLKNK